MSRITVIKCDNCGKFPIEPINSIHDEQNFCDKEECIKANERYQEAKKTMWENADRSFRLI